MCIGGQLTGLGLDVEYGCFFDTLSTRAPGKARRYADALLAENITVFIVDEDTLRLSCDELTTPEIRARFLRAWSCCSVLTSVIHRAPT